MNLATVAALLAALLFATNVHAAGSRAITYRGSCNGSSPLAVVRAYYTAINHHQIANAKTCLTPYYLRQLARVVDPDWVNVISIRALRLRWSRVNDRALPGNVPPADARPAAAAQVGAEFVVHYVRVVDSPNGLTIRFIYAVKQHSSSPWRIAAIGSGP